MSAAQGGYTPLVTAAFYGKCDVVIELLDNGAGVNAQNNVSAVIVYATFILISTVTTLGTHAQRGLRYLVCVCVCVCVCLMLYFSDTVSLYVEMKVPVSLVQHGADFYKKGFPIHALFESDGIICLPMTSYEGTAVTFCALFQWQSLLRALKWVTIC